MKLTVEFPEGLTETSERFLVVYRNQFGAPMWAGQGYDDLLVALDDLHDLVEIDDAEDPTAGMFDYT